MKALELEPRVSLSIGGNLRGLIAEMRPLEWSKNLLVFSGVIFSKNLTDPHNLLVSLAGFVLFCAASSGIYLFNDLCDLQNDRAHPIKRNRPLASGALSVNIARAALAFLFIVTAVGSLLLDPAFASAIAVYIVICVAYSIKLKNTVILDVILISSGFVLRAASGAVLIGVAPSEWLILCTAMVALLLGFGKRRHELVLLEADAVCHRPSLNDYSMEFLDAIMNICAAAALLTYALYTRADETVARVGSHGMLLTIPFVVYGVFRYLFLIHNRKAGGDPVQILLHDRPTLLNLLLWITTAGLVIYYPRFWDVL